MEDKYSKEETKTLRIGAIALFIIMLVSYITISHNTAIQKEGTTNTYNIYATFGRTEGLNVGDMVRMAGVSIGRVVNATLDENYNSKLTFEIDSNYLIPDDSSASIVSFGLLGGKYVEIEVGGSEEYIKPEANIEYTQNAMVLEELLERVISLGKASKNSKKKEETNLENNETEGEIDE